MYWLSEVCAALRLRIGGALALCIDLLRHEDQPIRSKVHKNIAFENVKQLCLTIGPPLCIYIIVKIGLES